MRAPSRRTKIALGVLAACMVMATLLGLRLRTRGRHAPPGAKLAIVTRTTLDAAAAPRARGCGAAHADANGGGGGTTRTTPSGRTFHVWGPASYDENRAYPVVLVFHGWASKGRSLQKWFKMEDYVEGAAFTVYPDSKSAAWDFSGAVDTDFTAEVLDAVADEWCVDRARVLAFGFSYGGRFVNHLGCTRPDLVRAIAAGAGAWDSETGCASALPVLVIHRTDDPTMRIAGGRDAAARWAKVDGCSSETEDRDRAHGCVAYRECAAGAVTFCEDKHHDDAWPAGWNHTVREEYRAIAWAWFAQLDAADVSRP
jgi:poly(3-hydroxybutyrate) depolymerase